MAESPRKVLLSEEQRMTYGRLPLDQQHATFCALGDRSNYDLRYQRGLIDFRKLITKPGIEEIGINWEHLSLLLGTECIDVQCGSILHELGQYVIAYSQNPALYAITNITWVVSGTTEHPVGHPHALQGSQFCMSNGNGVVKLAITDGRFSDATDILLTALRMRHGAVTLGNAYVVQGAAAWPIKGAKHVDQNT